ncbi:MAG: hypothetical protein WD512_17585 [Candidatus Paceibacterota bacterium]
MTIAPAREIFVWSARYKFSDGRFIAITFDYTSNKFDSSKQYDVFYKVGDTRHELSVSGINIIEPICNYSLGKSY